MGPRTQAACFDVAALWDDCKSDSPTTPLAGGGQVDPLRTFLLGAFFLLREMDLAAALREHHILGPRVAGASVGKPNLLFDGTCMQRHSQGA